MAVVTKTITFETRGHADMLNLTGEVAGKLRETKIQNGIVTLFTPSSTSALTTIEYETGCLKDFRRLFDEILPTDKPYAHNQRWQDGNGHSHARAALLNASLTIPFVDQELTLGTWQQILFVDFDIRPRRREIILQVMGE
jgi:secondary thiamine-phosphate synthase enzyme